MLTATDTKQYLGYCVTMVSWQGCLYCSIEKSQYKGLWESPFLPLSPSQKAFMLLNKLISNSHPNMTSVASKIQSLPSNKGQKFVFHFRGNIATCSG